MVGRDWEARRIRDDFRDISAGPAVPPYQSHCGEWALHRASVRAA